jgi:hypothetical protein
VNNRSSADPGRTYRKPPGTRGFVARVEPSWPLQVPLALAFLLGVAGCGSKPPVAAWQLTVKAASERSTAAYLSGDDRVDAQEFERARHEVAATGRADLAARVELAHCAAAVASLVFAPCAGFEPLRADAPPAERAYADYLVARVAPVDVTLLPEPQRALAAAGNDDARNAAALTAVADPLSRLVAAGVWFQTGRAGPRVIAVAVDAASSQGWRRPLLGWLGVALRRAEAAGDGEAAAQLQRRLARIGGSVPAAAAAAPVR